MLQRSDSSINVDEFRVALLSYAAPARIYASSKSRWIDFGEALELVMEKCVRQGTGGAYLVPRRFPSSILKKWKKKEKKKMKRGKKEEEKLKRKKEEGKLKRNKRRGEKISLTIPSLPRSHPSHPRRLRLCRGLLLRFPNELLHVRPLRHQSGYDPEQFCGCGCFWVGGCGCCCYLVGLAGWE